MGKNELLEAVNDLRQMELACSQELQAVVNVLVQVNMDKLADRIAATIESMEAAVARVSEALSDDVSSRLKEAETGTAQIMKILLDRTRAGLDPAAPFEEAARAAYEKSTANHPTIHANRFKSWDELSPDAKANWMRGAGR